MPRKTGKNTTLRNALSVVPSVKCVVCGKTHLADSEDFFAFYGNVTIGTDGGLIGDNFDEKGKLVSTTIRCRTAECMDDILTLISGKSDSKQGV